MTVTYLLSNDVGKVRSLVPDRPTLADGTTNPDGVLWSDEEIGVFLALEGDVMRAAALALERTAADQALLLKVLRSGTFSVDGAKLADSLLASAKALRDSATAAEEASGAFDWAELAGDSFAARERLRDQWLRGAS